MSELAKRVIVAIPAAILFIWVVFIGGIAFEILTGLLTVLIIWEISRMFNKMGHHPYYIIVILTALLIWFYDFLPTVLLLSLLGLFGIITVINLFLDNEFSQRWLISVFSGFYPSAGIFCVLFIRNSMEGPAGFWITIALLLMIWGNDVFAYFGGKSLGKHPLAPTISPKKTWEGFWFGFLGAAVGLSIVLFFTDILPFGILQAAPFVFIVSIFGPLGDLLASRLKRITGVKDSSKLIPGHGGFFDRFDALILTAPFFYFYLLLIL